ncbi:hypothetical protein L195_g056948 [Trifolium pratense]|uniref:Uncharacterized protein n=1 Tax=Trifolium pratense TaxID=57577 RepID=A0A2K3KU89_TRIPR|nr:hypothetical protein L195_g056948 [Trifolium pratense]
MDLRTFSITTAAVPWNMEVYSDDEATGKEDVCETEGFTKQKNATA